MKTWRQSCHSFHAVKALALPSMSKRATLKAPRWCIDIIYLTNDGQCDLSKANEGCIWYIPWSVPVALFLTYCLNLRDSYCVKTKAYSYAFIYMYVCPTSTHSGLQQWDRHCKFSLYLYHCKIFWRKSGKFLQWYICRLKFSTFKFSVFLLLE